MIEKSRVADNSVAKDLELALSYINLALLNNTYTVQING